MNILEKIQCHQDLAALDDGQRMQLCSEIRQFLVSSVSKTGGHLASNLGVVELTVAIETVFDTAKDRLVFDVGHQSYVHKLLTGRQAGFVGLRQFGGMAGFPKPAESDCDAFVAGHASTSVSIALGMARARTLLKQDYHIITLIGDGAATGGVAYEGLNDAAVSGEPMVIILNDNAMSIDRNVGGMALHLSRLRTKERYLGMKQCYRSLLSRIPGGRTLYRISSNVKDSLRRALIPSTIFESMGFDYLGPVDGHDLPGLISLLKNARDMNRPVVVHVMTRKGMGYEPAEEHPKLFHGVGKFDPDTGVPVKSGATSFSEAFGNRLCELAAVNERVCAVTAAMPGGTGLLKFKEMYPQRMFDVGIAEGHAVSMAGGLAKQGMIPVVAIYSTFLQRAYDMILQDIALMKLHVVLAVDRAGLVGEDGETHHGVFDVGFLSHIPGMTLLCPLTLKELSAMLTWAIDEYNGPVAIRYPRGTDKENKDPVQLDSSRFSDEDSLVCSRRGDDAVIVTYGSVYHNAEAAAELLSFRGIHTSVVRLKKVAPLPAEEIIRAVGTVRNVVVVEEVMSNCGVVDRIARLLNDKVPGCAVSGIDLGENFIPHGSMAELYRQCGLDAESIANHVMEVLKVEN